MYENVDLKRKTRAPPKNYFTIYIYDASYMLPPLESLTELYLHKSLDAEITVSIYMCNQVEVEFGLKLIKSTSSIKKLLSYSKMYDLSM